MPDGANRAKSSQEIIGAAALMRIAFDGHDLAPIADVLLDKLTIDPKDAGAAMDLATILILRGFPGAAMTLQEQALEIRRHYRLRSASESPAIRVLAIVTSGDFIANTPLEFLLQHPDFTLDYIYIQPGEPMPGDLPEYDVLMVAIAYSRRNAAILSDIAPVLEKWQRPVLNRPPSVLKTSREGIFAALQGISGVVSPTLRSLTRDELLERRDGQADFSFPALVRPVDSHAGNDLRKVDEWSELFSYLRASSQEEFYITDFWDYHSSDGWFRKYRIALIDGRPILAHMAIRDTWMIHYLNAGMLESADKRAEEEQAMLGFDQDFAVRHHQAFAEINVRLGLDYVLIDCGELPDGRLLVFEADTGMIVHDMDPADIYPYKRPQMQKLFAAFQNLVRARAAHGGRDAPVQVAPL